MKAKTLALIIPLVLAACSAGDDAPALPITISATVADSPLSRVSSPSDSGECGWTTGDQVSVTVRQGGHTVTSICTLSSDGVVRSYSPNLFWTGFEPASATAYYSNIEGQATNSSMLTTLADQSARLAYVMTASASAEYAETLNLVFSHQLANVKVKVQGSGAANIDSAAIYNFSACQISPEGLVIPSELGYIKMLRSGTNFEANVLPTSAIPSPLISFGQGYNVDVSGITAFEAGKTYSITITVND